MLNTSLEPWPSFTPEEADAASRVLLSNRVNYWTGEECRAFERQFADWTGADHAVALANGTVALDVALRALGVGPGDEVVVTPRTFLASISCVVNCGAVPVFADVDLDSGNITAASIAAVATARTRAVIVVHLGGWPCDMDPIMKLAHNRGFAVIEDCAQAHGALYNGRSVGTIGDIGAWSFCQDKIMTTGGEGGMVTTNDPALWGRMWSFKDHGKDYDAVYHHEHPPGHRWVHHSFGTNWRMTEMQAAIGLIQLRRMAEWTAARERHAARILDALARSGSGLIRAPMPADQDSRHALYKLYCYVREDRLASGWTRDRIVAEINARGVPCYQGSCSEVYLEPAFDNTPYRPTQRLPGARQLGETSLMFLVHPTLSDTSIDRVIVALDEVLRAAALVRSTIEPAS